MHNILYKNVPVFVPFFLFEMPKISVGRTTLSLLHSRLVGRSVAERLDDAKRRKKRMA